MDIFGLHFFAVQILFITVLMAMEYSRDQLLSLRAKATPRFIGHDQSLLICQLGLHQRGCRAGKHTRRARLAACSVTSSLCRTSTPGEIPVISCHRPVFTNNHQLISRTQQ